METGDQFFVEDLRLIISLKKIPKSKSLIGHQFYFFSVSLSTNVDVI
jgi:hypothetical protein